jgi:uncharacterized membrane protein YfcA
MSQPILPSPCKQRGLACGKGVRMTSYIPDLARNALIIAVLVTLFAGFVKGAVGFAMPLIMISLFSSFLSPDMALAGLVLPTLFSNISQAFRHGFRPAVAVSKTYWRILVTTVIFIPISAQFFWVIPHDLFLWMLGVPITLFALAQLSWRSLALPLQHRSRAEWVFGSIGGLYGGVSGIWGPPLIVYLLSIRASKMETVQVQGVVFLIGAVVLLAAHLQSGLLTNSALGFSALLVLPAIFGQAIGFRLQDRLDPVRFRRWTQVLLVITGLNLIRQASGL